MALIARKLPNSETGIEIGSVINTLVKKGSVPKGSIGIVVDSYMTDYFLKLIRLYDCYVLTNDKDVMKRVRFLEEEIKLNTKEEITFCRNCIFTM